jgi:glycerol-3-phosphate acyltransferase PlsY
MFSADSWPLTVAYALAAFAFGYLCGSLPFGVIITRLAGIEDIRAIGSGNIGATNVLRTGRRELAVATLAGDMLKGTLAVVATEHFGGHDLALLAGLAAFIGHLFPVWLNFRGGKGVATYIGILVGLSWPVAIAFCLIWLVVAALTKYSSGSALVASAASPLILWVYGLPREALLFVGLTGLLWYMHRPNIARLMAGTEGKIGQ